MDNPNFKDKMGRFITQGLFIDFRYDDTYAVYTLADEDKVHNGNLYPSLKRLYLQEEDPSEYNFANKYLYNWDHWLAIKSNKALYEEIRRWQEELEVKIRAQGIRTMLKLNKKDNFNAAKWIADGGWHDKTVGRPSKATKEAERKMRERALMEADEESARVIPFVRKD